jgi:hypothetical protein
MILKMSEVEKRLFVAAWGLTFEDDQKFSLNTQRDIESMQSNYQVEIGSSIESPLGKLLNSLHSVSII